MTIEVPQFRLRMTWPGEDENIFHVLNGDDDMIAHIMFESSIPHWQPRWRWLMSAFQYRGRPEFEGRCGTRQEAMVKVKEAWPRYLDVMEEDGWMERVRRQKRGVWTRMFSSEAEYRAAPTEIEALTGCLEGSIEEARLSLLTEAMAHWEKRNPPDGVARGKDLCGRTQAWE